MLLVALVLAVAPPQFPSSLTQPLLGRAEQFGWPRPAAFEQRWRQAGGAPKGFELVEGAVERGGERVSWGYYWVRPADRGGWIVASVATRASPQGHRSEQWRAGSIAGTAWELDDGGGTLRVTRWLRGALVGDEATAWVYATTLLQADGPLYAPPPDEPGDDARAVVNRLSDDPKQLATWARAEVKNDALYEQLRRYRPVGSCSRDTHPQAAARAFAELAYARGDLGRFLQLELRIMGDRFERVAWSSLGEAAHRTEAERLATTGIDVDTFLLGSLLAAKERDDGINAWRFARAVGELGHEASMLPRLQRVVTDPAASPFNRLGAAKAWAWISAGAGKGERGGLASPQAAALEALLKLDLHDAARFWAEAELEQSRAKP